LPTSPGAAPLASRARPPPADPARPVPARARAPPAQVVAAHVVAGQVLPSASFKAGATTDLPTLAKTKASVTPKNGGKKLVVAFNGVDVDGDPHNDEDGSKVGGELFSRLCVRVSTCVSVFVCARACESACAVRASARAGASKGTAKRGAALYPSKPPAPRRGLSPLRQHQHHHCRPCARRRSTPPT
jgi:hypothetical protein